jgi:O-antigen/teichoic acid export membrane protein
MTVDSLAIRLRSVLAGVPQQEGPGQAIRHIWASDSLRGRFARGAFWSLVGSVISQGAGLGASVVVARLLGQREFGQYGMILSTVGMLALFAGMGLGLTATKYVAEYRTSDPNRAGRIIALGSVVAMVSGGFLALCLFVLAPILADKTLNAPELTRELRIASIYLFLYAIGGAQSGALSGFEAFAELARINFLRGLIVVPLTALAVVLWRLPGAIWALVATTAITTILSQISLRRQCEMIQIPVRPASAWEELRILWSFSVPALLSGALVAPALWAAQTMLVRQPNGYAEMGLFSAAAQWRSAIMFIPGVIYQFAMPLLSNLHAEPGRSRYRKALRWNLILTAATSLGIAAPVALAAPYIMRVYGSGFRQGSLVLVISAFTAAVACVTNVIGTAMMSAGSVWACFAFNTMWAVAFAIGCHWLVPAFHALGLAGAMLAAYLALTAWQLIYMRRDFETRG